jgi:hypothetical protein
MRSNKLGNAWGDLVAEPRSVEHAVMANPLLDVMYLAVLGNSGTQAMRCLSLSETGDIVLLPFNS